MEKVEAEAHAGPSTTGGEDSTGRKDVTVDDIHGFIPPRKVGAPQVKLTKNQWYPIKMHAIPQGMHLMLNIVPFLTKMTYSDYHLLTYAECIAEPFESQ